MFAYLWQITSKIFYHTETTEIIAILLYQEPHAGMWENKDPANA